MKIIYDSFITHKKLNTNISNYKLNSNNDEIQYKSSSVPLLVRQCCEYLLEYGSTFVGLFRVPGKQSSIRELRDMYDRGLVVELNQSHSPATISSLLKAYLHSLPEPIIPTKYFDDFLEIGSRFKYNQTNELNALKQLIEIKLLNTINYAVLAYLCLFLRKITEYVQITKMDADNLAVVFGNNLIRPVEELDLNMIKGHNYNLLPLIKVLIDQSEYLFSNNHSSNQFHDSYEQRNESITKSSGFSSFSSLLSSNDHPVTANSRSKSMPSICMELFSSIDSANSSLKSQIDFDRQQTTIEKESLDHLNKTRTSSKINSKSFYQDNRPKRYGSIDLLDSKTDYESRKQNATTMDDCFVQQRQKEDNQPHPKSTLDVPISIPMPIRKMEKYPSKKGLTNKFGKSFSSFKSSMSKAIQSHILPNENESYSNDYISSNQSIDSQSSIKQLQNEIVLLKELLEEKDLLIHELRKTSTEERKKFDKEKFQLNQKILQLQSENNQLEKQLNLQ
uniref:Rho GTPase activating protein n=1 Tax=Adineta vaga TaxID=104782 RepID=B2ZF85_ADIVA|nr:Rho GTPase activating protein [Adineta vaga]